MEKIDPNSKRSRCKFSDQVLIPEEKIDPNSNKSRCKFSDQVIPESPRLKINWIKSWSSIIEQLNIERKKLIWKSNEKKYELTRVNL